MIEIVVDQAMCRGHGQCELSAPDYFELRDDGLAYVIMQNPGEGDLTAVEDAVIRCPEEAISLRRQ